MDDLDQDDVMVMQQILSTSTATLSAVELATFRGEGVEEVRERLEQLIDGDNPLVTVIEVDDLVSNDVPRRYYAVTEYGRNTLKEMGLYDQIGILHDAYRAADDPETADGWAEMDTIRESRPEAEWVVG